jgi:hypothetical protein
MDFAEIARRTGIEPRRLRYVTDRGIVVADPAIRQGRGVPRDFGARETIVVALAALLIDRGISKRVVSQFVEQLFEMASKSADTRWLPRGESPGMDEILLVELADNRYIRFIQVPSGTKRRSPPWFLFGKPDLRAGPNGNLRSYQPLAWVSVDLAQLARLLTA